MIIIFCGFDLQFEAAIIPKHENMSKIVITLHIMLIEVSKPMFSGSRKLIMASDFIIKWFHIIFLYISIVILDGHYAKT